MTAAADLPSRTYECCAETCQWTYFAGARSGPGPFFCELCLLKLTLRPEGAEPYAGGAVEPAAPTVRHTAQMEMRL